METYSQTAIEFKIIMLPDINTALEIKTSQSEQALSDTAFCHSVFVDERVNMTQAALDAQRTATQRPCSSVACSHATPQAAAGVSHWRQSSHLVSLPGRFEHLFLMGLVPPC